jgi:DNA primase
LLRAKGYTDDEIEKAGLIIKKNPNYYDRFRSRIMFPLFNSSGQIVGFSGRIFGEESGESGGKYINTPQTLIYDKSKTLYGFDRAKSAIRQKDACILVEGQMDVIMSHQAGFLNTVAVSGTALTPEHLRMIKRLTGNLILAFDSDTAGMQASKRAVELGLSQGFDVKAALTAKGTGSGPGRLAGKDPADIIKESPKEWEKAVLNSVPIIRFYLDSLSSKDEVEKTVLPYLALISNEIKKAQWVKEVAKYLGVGEEPVWEELKKIKLEHPAGQRAGEAAPLGGKSFKSRRRIIEERLLGIKLWQKQDSAEKMDKTKEKYYNWQQGINERLRSFEPSEPIPSSAYNKLALEAELAYSGSESLGTEIELLQAELEREKIKDRLEEVSKAIREKEISGDKKAFASLLKEFQELTKKMNQTRKKI